MSFSVSDTIERVVPGLALTVDDVVAVDEVKFDGTVTAVTYAPEADVAGSGTDYRTYSLINKGQDGNGSTVVASWVTSASPDHSLTDFNEQALTLSGTPANLAVVAGDVLAWSSVHTGSTGRVDPGGLVRVTIARGDLTA